MNYEYYYKDQTEQFQFVMIPKDIICGKEFEGLSFAAKLIYGLLRDKISLSRKNGWVDDEKRVYIIYTVKQVMEEMSISEKLAIKYMKELETFGLIEKKRQGLGLPNIIYVKNFMNEERKEKEMPTFLRPSQTGSSRTSQMGSSVPTEWEVQDLPKEAVNNTNTNQTEKNNTLILSVYDEPKDITCSTVKEDKTRAQNFWKNHVEMQIDYDSLVENLPGDKGVIDNIVSLMTETMTSDEEYLFVSKKDRPSRAVKETFLKIKMSHIEYVIEKLKNTGKEIGNIKQYVMSMLYNAPQTLDIFLTADVAKKYAAM